MLRCCTFSCTSTHTSCYEPEQLAMLMVANLQSLERSLQTTSARKTPQMAKRCPQPRWVCEAWPKHRLLTDSGMGRQWDVLKTRFPGSCIHIKTADKTPENFGSTCMLQSDARASKAMSWTTSDNFVLERKKGTFRRNPRRTKLLFRACKTLDFPLLKVTLPRDLYQKFISEIQKCINSYSFGHFPHRPCLVWCHHRHGLLQVLLPCFWRVWTGSIPIFFCSLKFAKSKYVEIGCWSLF